MKKTVFLCGPMRGVSRNESLAWRQLAADYLSENFDTLSPLRGREKNETFSDPRAAVIRDLNDIKKSDIILVNDTMTQCSMIGTSMEVFFAFQLGRPTIVFGYAHKDDYWLNYHSHLRVDNIENACKVI